MSGPTISTTDLDPKPLVMEYLVDPTFESNEPIPFISPMAQSRLIIRAIILKDQKLLEEMIENNKSSIYSFCVPRSLESLQDALAYAIRFQNLEAIKLLMNEKDTEGLSNYPKWLIEEESTGQGSKLMFGHAVRSVPVGLGAMEGNWALLKDKKFYDPEQCPVYKASCGIEHILEAYESDSMEMCTLETIVNVDTSYSTAWHAWLSNIHYAVRAGNCVLASQLIQKAMTKGGFGFNSLHFESLIKSSPNPNNTSSLKRLCVLKRTIGAGRITPIHCAAINPDPSMLECLLEVVPEHCNIVDQCGWTPVHYSAACISSGPLEFLIGRGISTNQINKDGDTPLHIACKIGREANVRKIMDAEAMLESFLLNNTSGLPRKYAGCNSILRQNKKGFTPFHVACKYGRLNVIKVLLESDIVEMNKSTPLQNGKLNGLILACQFGHLDVVKKLISRGAEVESLDKKGRSSLCHAVINGNAHIVSYLIRFGANHLASDTSGNSLVHYASAYGWYFNLQLLLAAGACPVKANKWSVTPLAIAFMKGHMGIVEVLLKQPKVNVNEVVLENEGLTLLLQTCSLKPDASMLARLNFLIHVHKADCNVHDYNKNTALHYIMKSEAEEFELGKNKDNWFAFEAAKLLLAGGCNLNTVNMSQETPIMQGIRQGCFQLVEQILQFTSLTLPSDPNSSGNTILHLLSALMPTDCATSTLEFFKKMSVDQTNLKSLKTMTKQCNELGQTPLLQLLSSISGECGLANSTCRNQIEQFLAIMLDQLQSDVNAVATEGSFSVLHYMAEITYFPNILKEILLRKPILDPVDTSGRTPLTLSILKRNHECTKLLLRAGANVHFVYEEKPMILLEASQKQANFKLIPLFIEKGGNISSVDPKNGNTILHYVCESSFAPGAYPAILSLGPNAKILVNTKNGMGCTPLHLAVNSRSGTMDVNFDLELRLLQLGANQLSMDNQGRIPLHYAFIKIRPAETEPKFLHLDPIELVKILTKKTKITSALASVIDDRGWTVLHSCAVAGGTISAAHLLSLMGPEAVNSKDSEGNTPLSLAVLKGNEACSLMFLRQGGKSTNFSGTLKLPTASSTLPDDEKILIWEPVKIAAKLMDVKNQRESESTIIQEIMKKDWEGILSIILEKMHLDHDELEIHAHIDAAIRTGKLHLALKLIEQLTRETKDLKTLLYTFCDQQNIQHDDNFDDIQAKVLTVLLRLGDIDASVLYSCLVLAAKHWNMYLCCELTKRLEETEFQDSMSKISPFGALFWDHKKFTKNQKIPIKLKQWAEEILEKNSGNILVQFPIHDSNIPLVRFSLGQGQIPVQYSPLIALVLYGNYRAVQWLLSLGSSSKVDANFQDSLGRSPIMHAVRLNDIKMVQLLLDPNNYTPKKDATEVLESMVLNLKLQDKKGWTVVHHLICPFSGFEEQDPSLHYASFEDLFDILVKAGAPVDESCLKLAQKYRRGTVIIRKLSEILQCPIETAQVFELEESGVCEKVYNTNHVSIATIRKNANEMVAKLKAQRTENMQAFAPPIPDTFSGISVQNGKILLDSTSAPFDVLLSQVDLGYGIYGLYNFFKIQIIEHQQQNRNFLFSRWGRVGEVGQYQKTPFPSAEDAIKEFKKIFRIKTGNNWENINNFTSVPKKYRLVRTEKRRPKVKNQDNTLKINFKLIESGSSLSSSLPSVLLSLMKKLSQEFLNLNLRHGAKLAKLELPFGYLQTEVLESAELILEKIDQLITERENYNTSTLVKTKHPKTNDPENQRKLLDKIVSLSEAYFTLMPVFGFELESIKALFELRHLRKQQNLIKNLLHVEFGSQLLLGAQLLLGTTAPRNPYDYIYYALGSRIQPLDPSSSECQIILEYIYNTSEEDAKPLVESIYRVDIPSEKARAEIMDVGNHTWLWHGTKASNLPSILHNGLQIAPLGYSLSGSLFGKGIYFGDMFAKSLKYSHAFQETRFMFLCDVALGAVQKVILTTHGEYHGEPLRPGFNCIKTDNSEFRPLPEMTVNWKGGAMQLGPKSTNILPPGVKYGLTFNEYIVPTPEQVKIKYLIEYRSTTSAQLPIVPMHNLTSVL